MGRDNNNDKNSKSWAQESSPNSILAFSLTWCCPIRVLLVSGSCIQLLSSSILLPLYPCWSLCTSIPCGVLFFVESVVPKTLYRYPYPNLHLPHPAFPVGSCTPLPITPIWKHDVRRPPQSQPSLVNTALQWDWGNVLNISRARAGWCSGYVTFCQCC